MIKNPGIDAFKQCTFSRFRDHHGIVVNAVHDAGNTNSSGERQRAGTPATAHIKHAESWLEGHAFDAATLNVGDQGQPCVVVEIMLCVASPVGIRLVRAL